MFNKKNDQDYKEPLDGIRFKTLVHGEKTLLAEFKLKKGKILPEHDHPHEQTGYLVSGRINLIIGGNSYKVAPGDSWMIPGGVRHSAEVIEESTAIEVFSPVRKDYLP